MQFARSSKSKGKPYPKRPLKREEFHDFPTQTIITAKNVHEETDCSGRTKLVGTHPVRGYAMHKYIHTGKPKK